MCGRIVDPNLRSAGFDTSWLKINPIPRRFNVKPTQQVYVELSGEPVLGRWGLIPSWHKGTLKDWKANSINARIEEVETKPTFRGPWHHNRCLMPVGGYYEWTGERSPKQPHYFASATNDDTLWLAALYSIWNDQLTVTIMTRAANENVLPIHDRMPVILNSNERDAWLDGDLDKNIGVRAAVKHHMVEPFGISDESEDLIQIL